MIKKNKVRSRHFSFLFVLSLLFLVAIVVASHNYGKGSLVSFNDTFSELINYSFYSNYSNTAISNFSIYHVALSPSDNATRINGTLGGLSTQDDSHDVGLITKQNISFNGSFTLQFDFNFTETNNSLAVSGGGADISKLWAGVYLSIFNASDDGGPTNKRTYCVFEFNRSGVYMLSLYNTTGTQGAVATGSSLPSNSNSGFLKMTYTNASHEYNCTFSGGGNSDTVQGYDSLPATGVFPGYYATLSYHDGGNIIYSGNLSVLVDNFVLNQTVASGGGGGGGSSNPYTSVLQNSTDLFTGSTINTTLWNISSAPFVPSQNGQMIISGTKDGDWAVDGRFSINSSYVDFSYDWTANITVIPIDLSGVTALNVSTNQFAVIGSDRTQEDPACAVQYQRSGVNVNVTAGIASTSDGGFDSTITGFGYGALNTTIFARYTASSRMLNCTFTTNEGNTTSLNVTLSNYVGRTDLSVGYQTGLLGLTGQAASGYTSIGWDNFTFTTAYAEQQQGEEESVPEFSDYALILALGLTVGGMMVIKKKKIT